jgi:segregation and condensation protein B
MPSPEPSFKGPAPLESDESGPLPEVVLAAPSPLPSPRQLSLPARLEAILYLKGKPLTLGNLAEIAVVPREEAELALITLMADYAHRDTALEIRQEGQRYSLQLRESLGDLVQSLLPVDLSTAALRTLATIALKKRILQSDLVELRGSGAYDHIKELLAQNFIERKRQSEGRSYWLSLSEKFHRTFAVTTVAGPARPASPRGAGAKAKTPPTSPGSQEAGAAAFGSGADGSSQPGAEASGVPDPPPAGSGPRTSALPKQSSWEPTP